MSGAVHLSRAQRTIFGQATARCRVIARHGKWLRREARACSGGDPELAARLVRRAMERLDELDARRFGEGDGEYLRELLRDAVSEKRTERCSRGGRT